MSSRVTIELTGPATGKSTECEPILRALPQWFGIEEANRQYLLDIESLPTLLALMAGKPVGFLTLKQHSPQAAEIHVMGVLPDSHRHGIGRTLVEQAEELLTRGGVRFLQVKTLSSRHPDLNYAGTRQFYQALGFVPLEEFPTLWGVENPCLQLIKRIG